LIFPIITARKAPTQRLKDQCRTVEVLNLPSRDNKHI
jgi:hypothetical protein